jgi:hypothetical protein
MDYIQDKSADCNTHVAFAIYAALAKLSVANPVIGRDPLMVETRQAIYAKLIEMSEKI